MNDTITPEQARIAELEADLRDLKALTAEDHPGLWRMQAKIERQRGALAAMNRRQASLRFALKVHEQAHGPLTRDEWVAARDALAETNPAHANRIDEAVVAA